MLREVESDFKDFCELAKQDDDEWVQAIGQALASFCDRNCVGLDLPSNEYFAKSLAEVRKKCMCLVITVLQFSFSLSLLICQWQRNR